MLPRGSSHRANWPAVLFAWKQTFTPCALGLLGLAIAVALFSYGYKASLLEPLGHPAAPFPVAKALVEHRFGYRPASLLHEKHRFRSQLDAAGDSHVAPLQISSPVLSFNAARVFEPRARFPSSIPLCPCVLLPPASDQLAKKPCESLRGTISLFRPA